MAYDDKKIFYSGAAGVLIATAIIASMQIQFSYGSGTLTILVTDPPEWGEATDVYINITTIEVHRADEAEESGWKPLFEKELELNLTDVRETEAVLLRAELSPGKYNIVRFEIKKATVTVNGENKTARVPSGKLKLTIIQGGITIEPNQESRLLIDIETRVVYSKGKDQYQLVPAAKAIPLRE